MIPELKQPEQRPARREPEGSDTWVGAHPEGKTDLRGMSIDAIAGWLGLEPKKAYRATQLFRWIHLDGARSFEEMTNLSKAFRKDLSERAYISRLDVLSADPSADGSTKVVWRLADGYLVESVIIPDDRRLTLCVSSQVGCAMACRFCVTGYGGFTRNLTSAEIVAQIEQAQEMMGERKISNLVFMGMGEPLLNLDNVLEACDVVQSQHGLNFSHRRITLSTVGIVPKMAELGERSPINLAVSLHASTQEMRQELIPPGKRYELDELVEAMRAFPLPKGKVITIEYILIDGVNCDRQDAKRLIKLLHGVPCKVNLIPYNENPFAPQYRRPSDRAILEYQQVLRDAGVHTVTRLNRGNDVSAACGQLGGYKQPKPERGASAGA